MPKLQKIDVNLPIDELSFDSGNPELNDFFFNDAIDYLRESYDQIYIIKENSNSIIIGYIAISCGVVKFSEEMAIKKKLKNIPGLLVGRLAVNNKFQRKGYGLDLIKKAVNVAKKISIDVGCRLLIVDAKTTLKSISFYRKYNFKFIEPISGEKIFEELKNGEKPKKRQVKMFFDLHQIMK